MTIDKEKLANGRALVSGELGGALPANPLAAVIEAAREAFQLGRDPANWPDYLLAALGDVDSALELSAARAAVIRDRDSAIAQARASNSDLRAALAQAEGKAARLESDLRIANGALATTRGLLAAARGEWPLELRPMAGERQTADGAAIRSNAAWRELAAVAIRQRGEALAEARDSTESLHGANATAQGNADRIGALESELAENREALAEWHGKATRAEAHCERFQAVALAVGATPIGELPARVRAAYAACTDHGAALNRMERESA